MSAPPNERLYGLLPSLYRLRDAAEGQPLRALLAVIERELAVLEADVEGLYDNWFVETCDEWVVPYVGDLVGVRGLLSLQDGAFSQRGRVANTLAYRRRKGTAAMLEQLARDVTGWPARAVEFFELLATTQHLNHVRPGKGGTLNLRGADRLELVHGPLEQAAHTADVRRIETGRGKHNIPNVGLFLWRLSAYPLARTTARALTDPPDGRYTFQPLGVDAPLFNRPRTETEITHLAEEIDLPAALRRRRLHDELEARRQALVDGTTPRGLYFGADQPVLEVFRDGETEAVGVEEIVICDLSDPPSPIPEGWRRPAAVKTYQQVDPATGTATPQERAIRLAVDPVLGRLAFRADDVPGLVEVSYAYGFSGDLGGGPYDRRRSLEAALTGPVAWQIGVTQSPTGDQTNLVATLAEAVQAWNASELPTGTVGVIVVMDNRTYAEELVGDSAITIPAGRRLVIVAADWPEEPLPGSPDQTHRDVQRRTPIGRRPHLRGNLSVVGGPASDGLEGGGLVVDGLLVEGALTVLAGDLADLRVSHATLAPGLGGGLSVEPSTVPGQRNERLTITLERSVCGRLRVPEAVRGLVIRDSFVDGGAGPAISGAPPEAEGGTVLVAAPPTEVEGSTVFGDVAVRSLQASNTIFTGRVGVTRRQVGCVRFSYLPPGSRAPRRYRCQPADAASAGRVFPHFTSVTHGQPGYGQLATTCPGEIATGADEEGEMGGFHFLQQAQRVGNLHASLDEYLRVGLEAGIFFAT